MNKLEQVTQILYTATDYADALAKLAAINANVTTYQSYSVIDEFGLIFFASRNYQLPLVITFDGVSPSVTVEHYQAVYAQQQLELSKSVPAHGSPVAAEHLCSSRVWNITVQSLRSTRDQLMKESKKEGALHQNFNPDSFMLGVSMMCGDGLNNLARAYRND